MTNPEANNAIVNVVKRREKNCHIIFDSDSVNEITSAHFNPQYYLDAGLYQGSALGRGTAHIVQLATKSCVLRHFRRGGAIAKLMADNYVWLGLERTRAWREWKLLKQMYEQQLPVPKPIAAQVCQSVFSYRANLITQKIEQSESLAQTLQKENLADEDWAQIGQTLRHFHQFGVFHADLNAHNILLDSKRRVYVIDFDKGCIKPPAVLWQRANLARLQRSLNKLQSLHLTFHFRPESWRTLLSAYESVDIKG